MLLDDVFDFATGSVVKRSCFGFADKFDFTPLAFISVSLCVYVSTCNDLCIVSKTFLVCHRQTDRDTKVKTLIKVVTRWLIVFFTTSSSLTDVIKHYYNSISAVFCVFVVSFLESESGLLQYYKYISR